jgi:hypothetical protein
MLFGTVDAEERAAWNVVRRLGRAHATVVAAQLPTDPRQADLVLSRLVERRLLMRIDEEFTVVDIPLAA